MNIETWLHLATLRLKSAGINSAKLDAEVIAAHILRVSRAWLFAHPEAEIPELAAEAMLIRRENREPLPYLIGGWEFYGHWFRVTADVLIPRSDTETLVEAALALTQDSIDMLDLCTGSGCVGISLALARPGWRVTGSDISQVALDVARLNAEHLEAGVEFVQSDGFLSIKNEFDLIVVNPPYIGTSESLMPEVAQYEPHVALYSGHTGYEFYERMAVEVLPCLRVGGYFMMEVGHTQSEKVAGLFRNSEWRSPTIHPDLSGIPRVVKVQRA